MFLGFISIWAWFLISYIFLNAPYLWICRFHQPIIIALFTSAMIVYWGLREEACLSIILLNATLKSAQSLFQSSTFQYWKQLVIITASIAIKFTNQVQSGNPTFWKTIQDQNYQWAIGEKYVSYEPFLTFFVYNFHHHLLHVWFICVIQGGVPEIPGVPNPTFSQTVGSITTYPHHCDWCHKQYASKAKLLQHQRKKHYDMLEVSFNKPVVIFFSVLYFYSSLLFYLVAKAVEYLSISWRTQVSHIG